MKGNGNRSADTGPFFFAAGHFNRMKWLSIPVHFSLARGDPARRLRFERLEHDRRQQSELGRPDLGEIRDGLVGDRDERYDARQQHEDADGDQGAIATSHGHSLQLPARGRTRRARNS